MSASPASEVVADLEQRAVDQRSRIHRTALELIQKVDRAKEQLSPAHNVRKYFAGIVGIGSTVAFLSGYIFGALFTR